MCDMTHLLVICLLCFKTQTLMCVTWHIHASVVTYLLETWLITHSFETRFKTRTLLCVLWLIHVCDTTHWCVWHDSFVCVRSNEWVTRHGIGEWVLSHTWMSHVTHINESCLAIRPHLYILVNESWVMSNTWSSHVTHINESCLAWRPHLRVFLRQSVYVLWHVHVRICVAVCCSVLQCVAVCCICTFNTFTRYSECVECVLHMRCRSVNVCIYCVHRIHMWMCVYVLQCVAVCCSVRYRSVNVGICCVHRIHIHHIPWTKWMCTKYSTNVPRVYQ